MVIPDPIPVSRWQLPVLTILLAIAGTAMIADRFVARTTVPPQPPRWTAETTPVRISLAGHALSVPANLIGDVDQRDGGARTRLDLTLRWPTLAGYDEASAPLFKADDKSLVRIWMEEGSTAVTNAGNAALAREGTLASETEQGDDVLRPEIYPVAGGLFARAFAASSKFSSEENRLRGDGAALRLADAPLPRAARSGTSPRPPACAASPSRPA